MAGAAAGGDPPGGAGRPMLVWDDRCRFCRACVELLRTRVAVDWVPASSWPAGWAGLGPADLAASLHAVSPAPPPSVEAPEGAPSVEAPEEAPSAESPEEGPPAPLRAVPPSPPPPAGPGAATRTPPRERSPRVERGASAVAVALATAPSRRWRLAGRLLAHPALHPLAELAYHAIAGHRGQLSALVRWWRGEGGGGAGCAASPPPSVTPGAGRCRPGRSLRRRRRADGRGA